MKIFVYNNTFFDVDVLICVDSKVSDIINYLKKYKIKLDYDDLTKSISPLFNEATKGFVCKHEHQGLNYYILYLKGFKFTWDDFDTLVHELIHLKQDVFESRGISEKPECEAYFIESTFREIRHLLTKYLKRK